MTGPKTHPGSLARSIAGAAMSFALALGTPGCQRSKDWNEVFHRSEGWWYSDGGESAALPDGRTVWLFGDTWLRNNGEVLPNSIAVQSSKAGEVPGRGEIRFFARNAQGAPIDVTTVGEPATRSWVEPARSEGGPPRTWLWPTAALSCGGKLIATYVEVGCVKGEYPACRVSLANMGFAGHSIIEIDNPGDEPDHWKIRTTPLVDRRGRAPSSHRLHWGSALLEDDGWLYVFGTSLSEASAPEDVKLARVVPRDVTRYDLWQFLTPSGWQMLPTGPLPDDLESLARGGATELSVQRVIRDGQQQLVMVQVDPLAAEVIVRTASAGSIESARFPGPELGASVKRHSLATLDPETAGGMSWSGRAHPHLSPNRDELLVSYFSEKTHGLRFLELPLSD